MSDGGTDTAALIARLTDRLLTGPSATAILEDWCRERHLGADPLLIANPVASAPRPPTPEQCERLAVAGADLVRYRRVRLTCGTLVLSDAENWYVPGRLTAAMNRTLETSTAPFGRVVHPLAPSRRNLGFDRLWSGRVPPQPETALFCLRAVLSAQDGLPVCEVVETYLGAVLDGAGRVDPR